MMPKITKFQAIITSLIGGGFVFAMESLRTSANCPQLGDYEYENLCGLAGLASFIFFPIFFFSIIFFLINKLETFQSWVKFTTYFFAVNLSIIIITPWYWGDGFMNIQKGTVTISLAVLYFLISLILIAYKSYKLRGK